MGTTSEVEKEDPKAGIRGHPRDPGRIRLSGHNLFSMSSCKNRAKGSELERHVRLVPEGKEGTAGERKPYI